jgi:hypothetical protein
MKTACLCQQALPEINGTVDHPRQHAQAASVDQLGCLPLHQFQTHALERLTSAA